MPSPARVLLCFGESEAERQAAASLAAGFARIPIPTAEPGTVAALLGAVRGEDLAIVSSDFPEVAEALAGLIKKRAPVIAFAADAERRAELSVATLVLSRQVFVKDVVTLARVLAMPRDNIDPAWGGELEGLHLYDVVRALGAARFSGVMGLFRGGRRGELRFFTGEVTSAQVGALHGQAAFHQVLLWPDATFDLRVESVVRRQQIPLSPVEFLQDAERFLRDFHDLSGGVSPAAVFDQSGQNGPSVAKADATRELPKEVRELIRLFDGERTLADVVEESPLRLTETLNVTGRLVALGVLVRVAAPAASAVLTVEDWLVGQPAPPPDKPHRPKSDTPARGNQAIDWSHLGVAGRGSSAWEAASYAPVVPSQAVNGEISAATIAPERDAPMPTAVVESEEAEVIAEPSKKKDDEPEPPRPPEGLWSRIFGRRSS